MKMRYLKLVLAFIFPLVVLVLLTSTLLAYTWQLEDWTGWGDEACEHVDELGRCDQIRFATHGYVYFTPTVTMTQVSLVLHMVGWPAAGLIVYAPDGCAGSEIDYSYDFMVAHYNGIPFTTTFGCSSLPGPNQFHLNRDYQHDHYFIDGISYESDYPPVGGWPTCATVNNADFDTSSNWTLSGGASITGSVLALPAAGAGAQQDFLIQSNFYTVTIVAQRISTGSTDILVVAMIPDGGHMAASDPLSLTADGVFHELQTMVTPDSTGDGSLAILDSGGSYQVDYICVEAASGQNTCTPENQVFDFEQGYNNEASLTSWGWGFSQGWKAIDYPLGGYAGGRAVWVCSILYGCGFETASMFAAKQEATIQFNYLVVPHIITVTPRYAPAGSQIQILASPDAVHWAVVDSESFDAISDIVTFSLDYAAPVHIAVAALSDTGLPIYNATGINQIEMDACYGGSNTFSDCIVGDPDLDISAGYPSHFYWYGGYTPVPGAAVLEQSGDLNQMITPPWAGPYNLEIVASSDNVEQPCSWQIEFTNYGSDVKVAQAPIQCGQGTDYTYSVPFILPAQSLVLWIKQTSGESSISRICLTPGPANASISTLICREG
jgi:hypothetical protein